MESKLFPSDIVEKMLEKDACSKGLGMEIKEIGEGYCKVKMKVTDEMMNGFEVAHGGISYTLADSAFAFASNSRGRLAYSIESSISHIKMIHSGDVLIADAKEESLGHRIGFYTVRVMNQNDELVAHFKGTVYRTSKVWE